MQSYMDSLDVEECWRSIFNSGGKIHNEKTLYLSVDTNRVNVTNSKLDFADAFLRSSFLEDKTRVVMHVGISGNCDNYDKKFTLCDWENNSYSCSNVNLDVIVIAYNKLHKNIVDDKLCIDHTLLDILCNKYPNVEWVKDVNETPPIKIKGEYSE